MPARMNRLERAVMASFLAKRFEDGLVFVRGREDRRRLKQAVRFGLVTPDGYLTESGVRFCDQHLHAPADDSQDEAHSPA